MSSKSVLNEMLPHDRAVFGYAKVRNAAYEAVQKLWRQRKESGLTQQVLADSIGMDPARLSKYLKGPGNWTLRTFGALVEGLDGEAEICVYGLEVPLLSRTNFHAYAGYETGPQGKEPFPQVPPQKEGAKTGPLDSNTEDILKKILGKNEPAPVPAV